MKVPKTLKAIFSMSAVVICYVAALAQGLAYTVQVASVETETEASQMLERLRANGIEAYWLKAEVPSKGTHYRVRIGRFGSRSEAQQQGERARSRGLINEFIMALWESLQNGARYCGH